MDDPYAFLDNKTKHKKYIRHRKTQQTKVDLRQDFNLN